MNELFWILGFIALGVIVFVGSQTVLLYLLFSENSKLQEENEKNKPPF
jgi:hypothetical protein